MERQLPAPLRSAPRNSSSRPLPRGAGQSRTATGTALGTDREVVAARYPRAATCRPFPRGRSGAAAGRLASRGARARRHRAERRAGRRAGRAGRPGTERHRPSAAGTERQPPSTASRTRLPGARPGLVPPEQRAPFLNRGNHNSRSHIASPVLRTGLPELSCWEPPSGARLGNEKGEAGRAVSQCWHATVDTDIDGDKNN